MPISPNSATRAHDDEGLRKACAEAVQELKAARKLLAAQNIEIEKQEQMLALETQISAKLKDLRTLNEQEKRELRKALAAKDRIIISLEYANSVLEKQRLTTWKVLKIAIVAGAAGLIVGKVLK